MVPITDLAVKEGDLIAATQGRSFWILDDLAPLRSLDDGVVQSGFHLFAPEPAWRLASGGFFRTPRFEGANPPAGAIVDFLLNDVAEGTEVALEFAGADGEAVRRFEGTVGQALSNERFRLDAMRRQCQTQCLECFGYRVAC